MARYVLVDDDAHEIIDHDLDVAEFARVNDLDTYEIEALENLSSGKTRTYGGGASPQVSVLKTEGGR